MLDARSPTRTWRGGIPVSLQGGTQIQDSLVFPTPHPSFFGRGRGEIET